MKSRDIDFVEILKKSFRFILKYKYLWFLGLLAGGGGMGIGNSGYTMSGSDFNDFGSLKNGSNAGTPSFESIGDKVMGAGFGIDATIWLVLAITLLVLIILMIYLSTTARGAIIYSVDKIDSGDTINFRQAWIGGHRYFWKMFLFSILIGMIIFVPILIFGGAIVGMVLLKLNVTAIIFGFLFLLVFVFFAIYFSLIIPYSERILILENISPLKSITQGFKFFNKNWKNAIIMYLILMAVNIGVSIVLAMGFGTIMLMLVLIGFLFYAINLILVWIYGVLACLALLVLLLIVCGIIQSYSSTAFTLTYREIKKIDTI